MLLTYRVSFMGEEMHNKRNSRTSISDESVDASRISDCSTDKDLKVDIICRVCHCSEPDTRGNAALEHLGISPPSLELEGMEMDGKCSVKIFVCSTDLESGGSYLHHNAMFNLGCSCKSDLAHAHYACALKWFISRGCTACEICGRLAGNVRMTDFRKVLNHLKEYEEFLEREASFLQVEVDSGADAGAVAAAAIRRQKLNEISLWFNLDDGPTETGENNDATSEFLAPAEEIINKSALECTGALLGTCLLLVFLLWFIVPRIGKKAALIGFYFLLGDLCALSVVIILKFTTHTGFVWIAGCSDTSKVRATRYWAVVYVFFFLAVAIWASQAHNFRAA